MEDVKTFACGIGTHVHSLRFDLIPRRFLERLAARFGMGAETRGDFGYRKGLRDREYILDRMNHLEQHWQAYLAPQNIEEFNDDNLAAIGWAAAFLMEVEADRKGAVILAQIRAERGQSIQVHVGKRSA